jgi:hypothetical protein
MSKTETDFDRFYRDELRPALEEFEERRSAVWRRLWSAVLLVGPIGAVVVGVATGSAGVAAVAGAACALVAGLVAWAVQTGGLRAEFKLRIIGSVARFLDPGLAYSPEGHISERAFKESGLFRQHIDRFDGEDLVSGKVGATAIQFSELHAEYQTTHTDSKGHTHTSWHTIFKGLFIVADFNKEFRGVTVVLPDVAEKAFGWLGQVIQDWTDVFRRGELVKLEDPEFEREFVVYADDQVEARYILTPSLMQRLREFKRKVGRQVFFSFARSNVYVAITTQQDMFEPRWTGPVCSPDLVRTYLLQLRLGLGVVDELDLNTRIWSKK